MLQVNDTASVAGKSITPVMQVKAMQTLQVKSIANDAGKRHHNGDAGKYTASSAVKSYYLANSFAFN